MFSSNFLRSCIAAVMGPQAPAELGSHRMQICTSMKQRIFSVPDLFISPAAASGRNPVKIINTKPAVSPSVLLFLRIEGDETRQTWQGHQQGLRVAAGQSEQDAATSASPPLPNPGHWSRGFVVGAAAVAFLRMLACGRFGDEEEPTNINRDGSKSSRQIRDKNVPCIFKPSDF